jgi:hypothetical protein
MKGEIVKELVRVHRTKTENEAKVWDKYLRWYRGGFYSGGSAEVPAIDPVTGYEYDSEAVSEPTLETNYLFAFIDSMIAVAGLPNAEVQVRAKIPELNELAQIRAAYIRDVFDQNDITSILWQYQSLASICGRAFLKVGWNARRHRPIIRVVDPRRLFYDRKAQHWDDVRYVIELIVISRSEWDARFKNGTWKKNDNIKFKKQNQKQYNNAENQDNAKTPKLGNVKGGLYDFTFVYEVYDFSSNSYSQWAEGSWDEPLLETEMDKRLDNPFTPLIYNSDLRGLTGVSDAQLIEKPLRVLNEIDTLELRYALASIPFPIMDTSKLDKPEEAIAMFQQASNPQALVPLDVPEGTRISDILTWSQAPPNNPSFYRMREQARNVIEYVLALPSFARGVVGAADVATEVALAEQATRSRNGRRQTTLRRAVAAVGMKTLAIAAVALGERAEFNVRTSEDEVKKFSPATIRFEDMYMEELTYDYEFVTASPPESAKSVIFQNLQTIMPLITDPMMDKRKILADLLHMLGLPKDRMKSAEKMAQEAQAQAQAQAQTMQQTQGVASDPLQAMAGGQTPQSVSVPPIMKNQ